MSSFLNLKIRGKKIEFFPDDENFISTALSFIWMKTNKKIKSCIFKKDRVKISYKKNEERVYFNLQESLLGFTFIDKVKCFPSLRFYFGQFCPFFHFLDNFVYFFSLLFHFLDIFVYFF